MSEHAEDPFETLRTTAVLEGFVVWGGPVRRAFLSLQPGLTVLYGRNGAGKTTILQSISRMFESPPKPGAELHFTWRPPATPREEFDDLRETDSYERWQSLPGNPWSRFNTTGVELAEYLGERRLGAPTDLSEVLRVIDQRTEMQPVELSRLARDATLSGTYPWSITDEDNLAEVVDSVLEIARHGRLSIAVNPWGRHASRPQLALTLRWATGDHTPVTKRLLHDHMQLAANSPEPITEDTPMNMGLDSGHGLLLADAFMAWGIETNSDLPTWLRDHIARIEEPASLPCALVSELSIGDLNLATIGYLQELCAGDEEDEAEDEDGSAGLSALLIEEDGAFRINPRVPPLVEQLSHLATRWYAELLEGALPLECSIQPPTRWLTGPAVQWTAVDESGARVNLESLSRAQSRWASFAVKIALLRDPEDLPSLVVVDEPEAALHRSAERHLVRGLSRLAHELHAYVVVATHSPAFLRADFAHLHHVHRNHEGRTVIEALPTEFRSRIHALGLEPADLLQFCRRAILVEGRHEEVIFKELFHDHFEEHGVEMFAMRGAASLKNAADGQLLFRYTDAQLCVVLDNEQSARVSDIWKRACQAQDSGLSPHAILSELTKGGWKSEAKFLAEFCGLAIESPTRSRIKFTMMSLPDIIDYLPVDAIAPKAAHHGDWSTLRERHLASNTKLDFKSWMSNTFDARYDDETIVAAVQRLDHIPEDFTALLDSALGV